MVWLETGSDQSFLLLDSRFERLHNHFSLVLSKNLALPQNFISMKPVLGAFQWRFRLEGQQFKSVSVFQNWPAPHNLVQS